MITPESVYKNDPTSEVLAAVRELLSRNPCVAHFGAETISRLLYEGRHLPYRVAAHEVECVLEVLRIDDEVTG
jgi:hypothetical protein